MKQSVKDYHSLVVCRVLHPNQTLHSQIFGKTGFSMPCLTCKLSLAAWRDTDACRDTFTCRQTQITLTAIVSAVQYYNFDFSFDFNRILSATCFCCHWSNCGLTVLNCLYPALMLPCFKVNFIGF